MEIKQINEELREILNEDVVRSGKMLQTGHIWTEEKIGEKEVEILGVTLKYDIIKFHVEDANEDEKDMMEYKITNPEEIKKIEHTIEEIIHGTLGDKVMSGTSRQIGIPMEGYIYES